jgi:hypothetical protein
MRRLARFGSGWIPWGGASDRTEDLLAAIPRMREAVAGFGRDPLELGIAGKLFAVPGQDGQPDLGPTIAGLPALIEAGVDDVRLQLPVPPEINAAHDYLAPWVAAFAQAADRPSA